MKKDKIIKYIGLTLLVLGTIDFPIPDSESEQFNPCLSAGVNGKHLKEGAKAAKYGWKSLRSCVGCAEKGTEKVIKDEALEKILKNTTRSKQLFVATEMLSKGVSEAKSIEEVLPKIEEYLSLTKPNEGGQKVINCLKLEANEVRMSLYEYESGGNKLLKNKIIRAASDAANLAEYDVHAMRENYYTVDGIEYVEFIIPRRPQYILDGQYNGRVYECMVFNVPKDLDGKWEKFKEYLIAFLNDLMNRPSLLWDEYRFRKGLADININSRDVQEMERYMFAEITNTINSNETDKYIRRQIA